MVNATAAVHIGPAAGAKFTQYTAEISPGGCLGLTAAQRFVYVLEGEIRAGNQALAGGGYAYLPAGAETGVSAAAEARIAVIEKPFLPQASVRAPAAFHGAETAVSPQPLLGDSAIGVRMLMPDDAAFDFAVNTMTFQPGAALPMVEAHVMEHGLLMLAGGGIYRLGDAWYPFTAGDFIWMAPYCPQWFGAIGKQPAKYLIYKDWNRHPLA